MVHTRATIDALLAEHGLSPRREFGQNFVVDANIVRKIVRLAEIGADDHVVEIGPGLGSLTLALADTGARVVAIEVDRGMVPVVRQVMASHPDVTVVEGDALRIDWQPLVAETSEWKLVANLPYNIATPLVCDILDGVPQIVDMLVMVQKEVGERLTATPRTSAYGAVSVKVAHWAEVSMVATVPPTVFVPRPNVDSALVRIRRRHEPVTTAPPGELFALVRTAFQQRRKMLRRSLQGIVSAATFDAAGIDSQRRPEELDVTEWGRLTINHTRNAANGGGE